MNELSMHLSDGPTKGLVRIHTQHTDWDVADVRYLLRNPHPATPTPRLYTSNNDRVVFLFGNVEVHVRATEDRVEVVLRHVPSRAARAA